MRCLDAFLERDDVRRIISRCRESEAVQGVNIRLDWRWLRAWRLGEMHDPFDPRRGYEAFKGPWSVAPLPMRSGLASWGPSGPWIPIRAPSAKDLDWRPDGANFPPIILTVRLYPKSRDRKEPPFFERAEDFRLTYESCPLAGLYSSPRRLHRPLVGGLSIGVNAQDVGTLGGILKDDAGRFYGLTCGHVAPPSSTIVQPAQSDGGNAGGAVGTVMYSETPPPFPSYTRATIANQSRHAGRVDAAIFEITGTKAKQEILKLGRVTGRISVADLEQDHRLEMTGRTSDWKVMGYGGLTPYHNLDDRATGTVYCYENPLMLRDPTGAQPVQPGDSGAWVCAPDDHGSEWAGMVVGGDGDVGFAVSADALKSWLEDAPRNLRLSTI